MLPLPTKECAYCDYTFTSKSMISTAQTQSAESYYIQNKFPFEPERVCILLQRSIFKATNDWSSIAL